MQSQNARDDALHFKFSDLSFSSCRDSSTRSQPTDYSSGSERSEELRTPDSIDEPWEGSDGRGSPQGGRRYPGMQMMGGGLLAEMKAKQERRAHKVRCVISRKRNARHVYAKDSSLNRHCRPVDACMHAQLPPFLLF